MTISKKLFLAALVGLGLQMASIRSEEPTQQQQIFDFAYTLQQQNNENAKIAGLWLEREVMDNNYAMPYGCGYYVSDKIILVLDAKMTLEEKIAYILQIKTKKEEALAQYTEEQNKSKKEQEDKRHQAEQNWKKEQTIAQIKATVAIVAASITLPAIIEVSAKFGRALGIKLVKAIFAS